MKTPVSKTCLVGPQLVREQFVAEHLFFHLIKGSLEGCYGGKDYTLEAGGYGLARKNRLGRNNPTKNSPKTEKVIFVFDEPFLRTFQEKHKIVPVRFRSTESFLRLPESKLVHDFINSLKSYYNEQGQIDKVFFDVKREELLLIILHLQPELSGILFDYGIPAKIDLEEFMNRNYHFNASIERFAYLTGRSVSAFKRDFKQLFNDTPGHWLVQMRLREAYSLIGQRRKRPTEIYLELGFEDISHFSHAFKKSFGITPTQLAAQTKA